MKILIGVIVGTGLLLVMMIVQSCSTSQEGPNGGDVVMLNNGKVKAEIVANADSGDIIVRTWDQNLKNSQPIENKSLMIGSGDYTMELHSYPTASDPSGFCSRFYGQADWLRGGQVSHGWLSGDTEQTRHEFTWDNCWRGGRTNMPMWNEMGELRRGMMAGASGTALRH